MKKLVIYLMSGAETPALAEAAVEGGADLVELGFPFSDPLADGPVIRRAAEQALAKGMRTQACLECLAAVRERVEVPLVPMTYSSLLEAYGWERFGEDARAAGATSMIVADLPAGDRPDLRRDPARRPDLDRRAAPPRSRADRRLALPRERDRDDRRRAPRFPPRSAASPPVPASRRKHPLYAGFGISTPEQARAAAELTDGIIVGSAQSRQRNRALTPSANTSPRSAKGSTPNPDCCADVAFLLHLSFPTKQTLPRLMT